METEAGADEAGADVAGGAHMVQIVETEVSVIVETVLVVTVPEVTGQVVTVV